MTTELGGKLKHEWAQSSPFVCDVGWRNQLHDWRRLEVKEDIGQVFSQTDHVHTTVVTWNRPVRGSRAVRCWNTQQAGLTAATATHSKQGWQQLLPHTASRADSSCCHTRQVHVLCTRLRLEFSEGPRRAIDFRWRYSPYAYHFLARVWAYRQTWSVLFLKFNVTYLYHIHTAIRTLTNQAAIYVTQPASNLTTQLRPDDHQSLRTFQSEKVDLNLAMLDRLLRQFAWLRPHSWHHTSHNAESRTIYGRTPTNSWLTNIIN